MDFKQVPKRTLTPKACFENRRLPLADYFVDPSDESDNSCPEQEELLIDSDEASMFKKAGLEMKASPRMGG